MDFDQGVRMASLVIASMGGFIAGMIVMVARRFTVVLERENGVILVPRMSVVAGGIGAGLAVMGSVVGVVVHPSPWTFLMAIGILMVFIIAIAGVIRKSG